MKKIKTYIVAAALSASLIISTLALGEVHSLSDDLRAQQEQSTIISEFKHNQLVESIKRLRAMETAVVKHTRPSVLQHSSAGRIHWYVVNWR
jgi:hypothetical protein